MNIKNVHVILHEQKFAYLLNFVIEFDKLGYAA